MPYNYSKLSGRIVEVCGSRAGFAQKMHLSERSISLKMSGKIAWTQKDISQACAVLSIEASEIPDYFFALKVR